jgi:acetyl-CoA synthetase
MAQTGAAPDMAWIPDDARLARSRLLAAVRRWGYADLGSMHEASIRDTESFWRAVVEDLDVSFARSFDRVLDESEGPTFPRWFPGGRLNVAALCAHRHAAGPLADKEAVVYEGDSGQRRSLTYAELDVEVRRFAANLTALGVRQGDRVVLFMPVVPEASVAFLGIAMIGAVSVPAFTGYGVEAVATRLRESGAVALITADGTTRRGNRVPLKQTADKAVASAPAVRHVIVVRHLADEVEMRPDRDIYWDELPSDPPPVETVLTESNDPVTIVYTSGTTGLPKGIVHSHAGFAVKTAVDFGYGFDVHTEDVVAWISDLGWLVGPMLIVGVLQLGATAVFTEGVPTHPHPGRMWEIVNRNRVTLQGIAPTAARAILAESDGTPPDLPSLRSFVSTGEVWDEPTWRWLFEQVGQSAKPIINFSGGTETGGGLLISYPFLPMRPASFTAALPGVDAAVFDQDGTPVIGAIGELVLRNTFPGMTHAFWRDRERYLATYWERWDGIWLHGDLASVEEDGTWRIHGRSDDTIKVSGRRIGPAEIEAALLKDPRIVEAAAIGVPDQRRGQRIVAFVVIRDGELTDDLTDDLNATAAVNVGRSFAPALHIVAGLPKTTNGKIVRRAIRSRYLGVPAGDLSALDASTPLEYIPILSDPATDDREGAS